MERELCAGSYNGSRRAGVRKQRRGEKLLPKADRSYKKKKKKKVNSIKKKSSLSPPPPVPATYSPPTLTTRFYLEASLILFKIFLLSLYQRIEIVEESIRCQVYTGIVFLNILWLPSL